MCVCTDVLFCVWRRGVYKYGYLLIRVLVSSRWRRIVVISLMLLLVDIFIIVMCRSRMCQMLCLCRKVFDVYYVCVFWSSLKFCICVDVVESQLSVRSSSSTSERGSVVINNNFTGATLTFHGGNLCLGMVFF